MIDLRRLQVLRAVGQHGTVTAAAHALRLTPSAVSQQLRLLSRELGVELLEPQGRGVRLTSAAYTLLSHADALHARWEQARADLAAHRDGAAGPLHLVGFPTAIAGLVAPAAARLRDTCPDLVPRISEADPVDCFPLLLAGDADIAVAVSTPATPPHGNGKFEQHPLLEEPQDLLVPADHPLAGQTSTTLIEAAHESWIFASRDSSGCRELLDVACAAAGFTPDVVHEAKEWLAVTALVAHGFGVSLIPRLAPVPPEHAAVRVPLRDEPAPRRRILAWVRCSSATHPLIAHGLSALRDVAAGVSAGTPSQDSSEVDAVTSRR